MAFNNSPELGKQCFRSALAAMVMMLLLPGMSAVAMDAMTAAELDALSGKAGLTIAFGNTVTTRITVDALSFGDTDGIGVGRGTGLPGWLKLSGVGGQQGTFYIEVPEGSELSVDVHTVMGGTYTPPGGNYGLIQIPDGTTFFSLGLTSYTLGWEGPDSKIYISLDPASGTISDPAVSTGWVMIQGRLFHKPANPEPSLLYLWAH